MTPEDTLAFQNAIDCYICDKPLDKDRVRDHCHTSGTFRGAAHNACNLKLRMGDKVTHIPVVFHNLKGYDGHLIMQAINASDRRISCIPNNSEKYISFSIGSLRFIDSLQFMAASLDKLTSGLPKEKSTITRHNSSNAEQLDLLLRKGVYPYSYMDSWTRFSETSLPPQEAFFSELTQEHISDDDYRHAQKVWNTFQCKTLKNFHDLYLKTDVLLLADIFENFRSTCLHHYKLDPAHYFTSPGLSWDALMRKSGIELELLTDIDQHLFIESGLRGGIAMISHRLIKANNPYLKEYYDKKKGIRYIVILDANNLYGEAMSQYLPTGEFVWVTEAELEVLMTDVTTLSPEADTGYILEVDLEYPAALHDLHNDYPLAPESLEITEDMLSPYAKSTLQDLNLKTANVKKLVSNLMNKTKYVVHYRNLQLYLKLGLRLTKIHRALSFAQSPWMRSYIPLNTQLRTKATTTFEKDFFKLMNNSVFGKTMENLRNREDVRLINKKKQLNKLTAKSTLQSFTIFHENLAAVHLRKSKLKLNKPIYVGFSVLDLSKIVMYQFHYEVIKARYGNKAKLCFTDTDSLCYEIETDDLYEDMNDQKDLYDFSEYPTDHPLYDLKNKKVLGKMKDETNGIPPRACAGLRPKMYSLKCDGKSKKTAKGIKKSTVKNDLTHEMYVACLTERTVTVSNMTTIQSSKHELFTVNQSKLSLSPYDDKRYLLADGISSYAYGHYKIPPQFLGFEPLNSPN